MSQLVSKAGEKKDSKIKESVTSLRDGNVLACVASVPEQRERNSGARRRFSHSGRSKNGARAKTWKERGGVGERRERLPTGLLIGVAWLY